MVIDKDNCDNVCETCSEEQNLECWGEMDDVFMNYMPDEILNTIDPVEDEDFDPIIEDDDGAIY